MNRFYKTADAAPAEAGGFAVTLDGRPIRTPGKRPLTVPTRALADAIALEWAGQGDRIRPEGMPLTQLSNMALDRIAPQRTFMIDAVLEYAETDLLSHRAETPLDLAERQSQAWQPLLDWASERHGAALETTAGLVAVPQPAQSLAALRRAVEGMDDWRLTALQQATGLTGSVILGLALVDGRIDAVAADAAAHIDEDFQTERWGEDAEARDRRNALRAELEAVERLVRLVAA